MVNRNKLSFGPLNKLPTKFLRMVSMVLLIGFLSSAIPIGPAASPVGGHASAKAAWGFYAHRMVNRMAVFILPEEMVGFYKRHIDYITENAVSPDARRYAVKGEAEKHFIDLDIYGENAVVAGELPKRWDEAVEKFTEDSLRAYGIGPWNIMMMKNRLTNAFVHNDPKAILKISTELGHYIGDINVPLHTTENYNGQFTGQYGIHGLWESRLPEIYAQGYDFFVGQATYIDKPMERVWNAVASSHAALDSVFRFEKEATMQLGEDKKYSFEERGMVTVKVYSKEFCKVYHQKLNGQVERRMRDSVKMVADFWFTCWVDAGQPDLDGLLGFEFSEKEKAQLEGERSGWRLQKLFQARPHEDLD